MNWFQNLFRNNSVPNSPEQISSDDVDTLAMRALWSLVNDAPTTTSVWMRNTKKEELDAYYPRVQKAREWLKEQDLTPRIRHAYKKWLDFCDKEKTKIYAEIVNRTRQRQSDEYKRKEDERRDRLTEANKILSLPTPPSEFKY